MRIVENNPNKVIISSGSNKRVCLGWVILLFAVLLSVWVENNFILFLIALIVFGIFISYKTEEVVFDAKSNKIYLTKRILGILIRQVEAPLKTSKLMVELDPRVSSEVIRFYLVFLHTESGEKYNIGVSFLTVNGAEKFLEKLTKHISIRHGYCI